MGPLKMTVFCNVQRSHEDVPRHYKTCHGHGPSLHKCSLTYGRERAAFQWSPFGRSTAGNDVVATIFPVFPPLFLLRRDLFS